MNSILKKILKKGVTLYLLLVLFLVLLLSFKTFLSKINLTSTKTVPFITVGDFEKNYIQSNDLFLPYPHKMGTSYKFIETIEFKFSTSGMEQHYSNINKNFQSIGIVFSFVQVDAPVNYSLFVYKNNEIIDVAKGGFDGESVAVYIKFELQCTYQFNIESLVPVNGKINIYEIIN